MMKKRSVLLSATSEKDEETFYHFEGCDNNTGFAAVGTERMAFSELLMKTRTQRACRPGFRRIFVDEERVNHSELSVNVLYLGLVREAFFKGSKARNGEAFSAFLMY